MATFRLVLPPAPWLRCLAELRANYADALRREGHAVTLTDTYLDTGERGEDYQLAFGAHVVAPPVDPARMVICQSEHHDHHFSEAYRGILSDALVVMNMGPFDEARAAVMPTRLVECAPGVMPIESVADVSPFLARVRDIDVLHYGSVTPRRARVFEALSKAGVHVHAVYGVLGPARDSMIDRAKIVLDLKQEGNEPDDQTRAWWALSRGACVLSENAPADLLTCKITPENVVGHVLHVLRSSHERYRLREAYADRLGPTDVAHLLKALGL